MFFRRWLLSDIGRFASFGFAIWLNFTLALLLLAVPETNRSPLHGYLIRLVPFIWVSLATALTVSFFTLRNLLQKRLNFSVAHERVAAILLIAAGVVARAMHLLHIDVTLPYTAGGLFVQFAETITQNSFMLPQYIPFYAIPFGYPPLSFYILAIVIGPLGIDGVTAINFLPPFLSIFTMPLVYMLARRLGFSTAGRLFALTVFAVLPSAYVEFVESAGLAEVVGELMLLSFAICLVDVYKRKTVSPPYLTGLLFGGCVLASPGSAYASVLLYLAFVVMGLFNQSHPRPKRLAAPFIVGLVGVAFSAPYWLTVISNHGIDLFTTTVAGQYGAGPLQGIQTALQPLLLHFRVAYAEAPIFWDALILVSFVWAVFTREWLLPIVFLAFAAIPREGRWLMVAPAALQTGMFLSNAFKGMLAGSSRSKATVARNSWNAGLIGLIAFAYVVFNVSASSQAIIPDYHNKIWADRIEAMQWVRFNTPGNAKVISLSNEFVTEWTPNIAKRGTVNVVQGLEWLPARQAAASGLNGRLERCADIQCVKAALVETDGEAEYWLLIDTTVFDQLSLEATDEVTFEIVWSNSSITIGRIDSP
jgi:hypothetical protein